MASAKASAATAKTAAPASTTKPPAVQFVDNPNAPELYASGATGFFVSNGTISITLESLRADHGEKPGPLSRVVWPG